jgi:hypothetical protein
MPSTSRILFPTVQAYLNAVADKAANGIDDSPHVRFWNIPYDQFINGIVPDVKCNGSPVPIIDKTAPLNSPFFVILTNANGWCRKRQMPEDGPFITDPGYSVTLAEGTSVTGQKIQDDLADWLAHGFPNV